MDKRAEYDDLLEQLANCTDIDKVQRVNTFFNLFIYVPDYDSVGLPDRWEAPKDTITKGGGDCEDFAIAKYFTLTKLGVNGLRLAHVTYQNTQAHMVLLWGDLVLDNMVDEIKPLSLRPDLKLVYSFDEDNVYVNGVNVRQNNLKPWISMLSRKTRDE